MTELLIIIIIFYFLGSFVGRRKERRRYARENAEFYEPRNFGLSGCFKSVFTFVVFCIILLWFIGDITDEPAIPSPTPTAAVKTIVPTAIPDPTATPAPTATPTTAPTDTPEPTATPEPETLQEWAETIAQRVYGRFDYEYTDLISVSCYQVDGDPAPMVEIYAKYPAAFLLDNDERMSNFLYNAKRVTEQLDELAKAGKIEYGSVFIHGRTGFIDKYGTETEGDAASIRIKAKEAAKVTNWDNILSDYLPELAVSFGIHTVIRDGLTYEYLSKIR